MSGSGAFLGFADGGENEARRARCEARMAESGVGVHGRQTVLLHFKYSGWPLLAPFFTFFDGDGPPSPPRKPAPGLVSGCSRCVTVCASQAAVFPGWDDKFLISGVEV